MSLLSIDITKVKKLSLREVKLPDPKERIETTTPIKVVSKPPTDEEIAYSKLVAINPLIEDLTDRLGLVSITTGQSLKKVALIADNKPTVKPQGVDRLLKHIKRLNKTSGVIITETSIRSNGAFIGATEEDIETVIATLLSTQNKTDNRATVIALAQRVIAGERSYTKSQIIELIMEATKVNQDRAEIGYKLMIETGAIEQTLNPELYYLGGSTPF